MRHIMSRLVKLSKERFFISFLQTRVPLSCNLTPILIAKTFLRDRSDLLGF